MSTVNIFFQVTQYISTFWLPRFPAIFSNINEDAGLLVKALFMDNIHDLSRTSHSVCFYDLVILLLGMSNNHTIQQV